MGFIIFPVPFLHSFFGNGVPVLDDVNLTAFNKKQMVNVSAVMQVAGFDSAVSQGCRCYSDSTNGRRKGVGDLNLMFTLANYISGPI